MALIPRGAGGCLINAESYKCRSLKTTKHAPRVIHVPWSWEVGSDIPDRYHACRKWEYLHILRKIINRVCKIQFLAWEFENIVPNCQEHSPHRPGHLEKWNGPLGLQARRNKLLQIWMITYRPLWPIMLCTETSVFNIPMQSWFPVEN